MTLYTGTGIGTLTINPNGSSPGLTEVVFPSPCWGGDIDVSILWGTGPHRGENTLIPFAHGRVANRRFRDEASFSLPFTIIGDCDPYGDPYGDPLDGLATNVGFLIENIGDPPPGSATRNAELVMPDGSTRIAEVQTQLMLGEHVDAVLRAVLEMVVPAGRFVEDGS